VIWIGITLFFSFFNATGGGIAHLAHLGGIVFAFLYVGRFWRWRPGTFIKELKYRWRRRRFKTF
jgi:membrane associated rhomboid family serine protease